MPFWLFFTISFVVVALVFGLCLWFGYTRHITPSGEPGSPGPGGGTIIAAVAAGFFAQIGLIQGFSPQTALVNSKGEVVADYPNGLGFFSWQNPAAHLQVVDYGPAITSESFSVSSEKSFSVSLKTSGRLSDYLALTDLLKKEGAQSLDEWLKIHYGDDRKALVASYNKLITFRQNLGKEVEAATFQEAADSYFEPKLGKYGISLSSVP
ncbi:MAG TPA: hypothetical protein VLE93_01895 [Candidatus Saccharimonadales bacterium]|nr:hypothetical protein [Candidatus Saccharimonadales bacterium]